MDLPVEAEGHRIVAHGRAQVHAHIGAHAFETLGCAAVGLRTDNFNFASQRAIAALGAKKDGVIRHHALRRDGSVRDTVLFSILAHEWHDVRKHLEQRLAVHAAREC